MSELNNTSSSSEGDHRHTVRLFYEDYVQVVKMQCRAQTENEPSELDGDAERFQRLRREKVAEKVMRLAPEIYTIRARQMRDNTLRLSE